MKRKEFRNPAPGDSHLQKFIRVQDLTLGVALVVICVGFFAMQRHSAADGTVARITLDSTEIRRVALGETDDYTIRLEEEYGVPVSFEVKAGAIRFIDVTCPDHLCEQTGFVSSDGQTAVCMPNKVAVHVVAE